MRNKVLIIVFLALCVPAGLMARTVQLTLTQNGSDVTELLKKNAKGLTPSDTLSVVVNKGDYYLSGTVKINASVMLSGKGRKKSRLVCVDNNNFTDDCYLHVSGLKGQPVAVMVKDLNLSLAHHDDFWWDRDHQHYLLKIYHANHVDISNIESYMNNSTGTNLNMRVCSNVNISNCKFTNYNNNRTGGILWINGNTDNVTIKKNKFFKYGNDETIALFGTSDDAYKWNGANVTSHKRNIEVVDNEFHFEPEGKDQEAVVMDVAFSIFSQEGKTRCVIPTALENIRFSNNKIIVDCDVKDLFMLRFEENTTHDGIAISDNEIEYTARSSQTNSSRVGVRCIDYTSQATPIDIERNTLVSRCVVVSKKWNNQTFLVVDGARVNVTNNTISTTTTDSELSSNKRVGTTLVWIRPRGGSATLTDNHCTGLYAIANLSDSDTIQAASLCATGNYFDGCTSILCGNIKRLDIDFSSNTFESSKWEYFLVEFAKTGSIVFKDNTVNARNKGGALLCHYKKENLSTILLDKLEITGNILNNVNRNDFLNNLTPNKNSRISSNLF
ncbi:MAG: hypothetical protein J6N71_10615 [Muribaculaceae bacterium]|nr:hypothetical protein [Muribaculaceae bacterium]